MAAPLAGRRRRSTATWRRCSGSTTSTPATVSVSGRSWWRGGAATVAATSRSCITSARPGRCRPGRSGWSCRPGCRAPCNPNRSPRSSPPARHLRDRLLIGLLAETGMRVGQALGLRHSDFVTRELDDPHRAPRRQRQRGAHQDPGRGDDPDLGAVGPAVFDLHARRVRRARLGLRVRQPVVGTARTAAALPGGAQTRRPAATAQRRRASRCTCCATPTPPR